MRRLLILSAAILATVAAVSCNKYEKVAGDPMHSKVYTLDNGLKVYMTVNKEEPRIQTFVAVRVGGKNDPKETTGLAHYFEHLMFKGSESFGTQDYAAEKPYLDEIEKLYEQYRTITDPAARKAHYHKIDSVSYLASQIAIPNEYDKMMSMIGSRGTNAWTSYDETVYTEDIPSNQVENWAKIQADRFRHNVIRGFHTELEAVYEEYNMNLTSDNRKMFEAVYQGLFPHHPYGTQTVLGTQEQLKNPSITNIKRTFNTFYRPNNIAICLSGDFNPKEMVKIIEKYFGDWEPNPEIPVLQYEKEEPITEPVVKEVLGLQAEMFAMGWRLPGSPDLKTTAVSEIASSILSNGQAGLIDLDINQQQKAMYLYAGVNTQPDYSMFLAMGMPKQGQTLEEVKDLALGEIAKLRAGEFDEELITSTVNNIRLMKMRQLESNRARANMFVDAFIAGIDWKDAALDIERYNKVTKQDVVDFANEYLLDNNFTVVYKRQGVDPSQKKIEAPAITPIATNRDKRSAFLDEIAASEVKPIEPVFVDFSKDMKQFSLSEGVNVLYKKNVLNDVASVQFIFNRGTEDVPALEYAFGYLAYLGTPEMTSQEIARKMYDLACDFNFSTDAHNTVIRISGLSENIPEAVRTVESLLQNAVPDEAILANYKSDILKGRVDAKTNQRVCFSALQKYLFYGPEFIAGITMPNDAVSALTSEDLLSAARDLVGKGHEILYYGPVSEGAAKKTLAQCHSIGENPEALAEKFTRRLPTDESRVIVAPYDSKQFYYIQYTDLGGNFDAAEAPGVQMYNEYFGGGMNSIVFQEMREARGLAYSAYADLDEPSDPVNGYMFYAFIASQNDKLRTASEAFKDIIENMPESEAAFAIAKDGILSRIRTKRVTGANVLNLYRQCRRLGLSEPTDKAVFEAIQGMTLEDVKAVQQKWVSRRNYIYGLLGDPADLDRGFLKTLGPVKDVTLEEVFGY
jgi:predicted Zn-dependent peptidase